jgi:predicted alpha/beta hydrolase family esterase
MTLAPDTTRVLVLPGWQDSGPGHWQSRGKPGTDLSVCSRPTGCGRAAATGWRGWTRCCCRPEPESPGGCWWRTAWAATWWPPGPPIRSTRPRVAAALLVALPDTARADMPPQLASWRVITRQRLPFAAQVVYSDDDPYCAPERALAMAADWGAPALSLGAAGHINADTGLGDWPQGLAWLRDLVAGAAPGPVP